MFGLSGGAGRGLQGLLSGGNWSNPIRSMGKEGLFGAIPRGEVEPMQIEEAPAAILMGQSDPVQLDFTAPSAQPQDLSKSVPQVTMNRPMLGRARDWMQADIGNGMTRADMLYTIGAGLKDMGGGQGNLDAARQMFTQRGAQQKAEAERKARAEAYAAAMGAGGFNTDAYFGALAKAGLPVGLEDRVQAEQLRRAQRPEYEYFDDDFGNRYRDDPYDDAAPEQIFTNPKAGLREEALRAEIEASKALAGQRGAAAHLSGVRADAGGFAPRAAGGSGAGGGLSVSDRAALRAELVRRGVLPG